MILTKDETQNWMDFQNGARYKPVIKKGMRKVTFRIDENVWREFSVVVLRVEKQCRQNSRVIGELIEDYCKSKLK